MKTAPKGGVPETSPGGSLTLLSPAGDSFTIHEASARNGADRDTMGPLETPASSGGGPGGSEWSR